MITEILKKTSIKLKNKIKIHFFRIEILWIKTNIFMVYLEGKLTESGRKCAVFLSFASLLFVDSVSK